MQRRLVVAIACLGAAVACERAIAPSGLGQPVVLSVIAEAPVSAAIVDVTAGSTGTFNFPGQSVTIPSGTYDHLRFNWYTRDKVPIAFGTLYLLSAEFLGIPSGLSTAQAAVVKSLTVADGEYVFPEDFTVSGSRKYWFYGDVQGSYVTSFDIDTYAGGDSYNTGYSLNPFSKTHASGRYTSFNPPVFVPAPVGLYVDTNFRLRGNQVAK